jgi:superoxide dismutase, Cu-Zn family
MVGDLGNIASSSAGISQVHVYDQLASLDDENGSHNIIGKSLVVHQKEDDLGRGSNPESKVNGNVGPALACCIISIETA